LGRFNVWFIFLFTISFFIHSVGGGEFPCHVFLHGTILPAQL
jgi:hypothetical protein